MGVILGTVVAVCLLVLFVVLVNVLGRWHLGGLPEAWLGEGKVLPRAGLPAEEKEKLEG